MGKNNNLSDYLTDLADVIREKSGGGTNRINPQDFAERIRNLAETFKTDGETIPLAGGEVFDFEMYGKGVILMRASIDTDGNGTFVFGHADGEMKIPIGSDDVVIMLFSPNDFQDTYLAAAYEDGRGCYNHMRAFNYVRWDCESSTILGIRYNCFFL